MVGQRQEPPVAEPELHPLRVYRLDDLCVECPCSVFTFAIIMVLLALVMVASLLLLDLFNNEFSSHTSTLAAPFLIMITFAQVSLRNANTCFVS